MQGSTQNHWPFPLDRVLTGYAYILTHPGVPCLQWEALFEQDHLASIGELVRIRKRNGIHARSSVQITCAKPDMYVACIGGRVILKLGPRFDMGALLPRETDGWQLAASGPDFAVWDRRASG